jgi:hypothetical protein
MLDNDNENFREISEEALSRFADVQTAMQKCRDQCLEDRKFYSLYGAQWEGNLSQQFENKPKFEVNKVHLSVLRVINEYRNNRITVNFVSKDGSETPDDLADVLQGLYRADEQDSVADEAYDNAFEESVAGGFGAWRLRADWEDDADPDDDRQRIKIEPIFDADTSVYFDLDAKRQDKSDAKYCFVVYSMTPKAFEKQFGKENSPASWPKDSRKTNFNWARPDVVYVAEYYLVEEKKEPYQFWEHIGGDVEKISTKTLKENPEKEAELIATGATLLRKKNFTTKRVRKYLLSGNGVLEDCGYIAGQSIPIVPAYGKRWFIEDIEWCMGHVRMSKDPQRLKNMQLSKLAEISAVSSIEKPIFTPQQIAGHRNMWADDNTKNYPYLLVNPITDATGQQVPTGPVGYTRSPVVPPAMAALLGLTEQDMQEIMGSPQQAEKMVSNISGKAVDMIQQRLDMQTFIYMSNFAKAMKRCGEIWLSMAKELYTQDKRKMKYVMKDEKIKSVELMRPMVKDDVLYYENDLTKANFNVAVDVGPSSSSRKSATVRSLTGMLQITDDPETKQVLLATAMLNMEGEGISDVRDYFRKKLVRAGVVKPTETEIQAMQAEAQNQQQDANTIYLQAAAEEATAKATKARADTVETLASAGLKRAQTAKTLSDAGIPIGAQLETATTQPPIG